MNHNCVFEIYDHIPCKTVPLILGFPGGIEDHLTIASIILIKVTEIHGLTKKDFNILTKSIGESYNSPCMDEISQLIIEEAKEKYE